ncbi:hypothetical protein Tco_0576120 [Tanacetum coccineum]
MNLGGVRIEQKLRLRGVQTNQKKKPKRPSYVESEDVGMLMNELRMDIDDQTIIASSFVCPILKDASMSFTSVQSLEHEVSVATDGVADTWLKLLLYIYVMLYAITAFADVLGAIPIALVENSDNKRVAIDKPYFSSNSFLLYLI